MKDNKHENRSDFEELRRLLLGDEIEKIEQVHTHVEVPENFSSQVGEILPQALIKSSEQGEALSQAMVPTVEEIVRLSVKKDINRFADALFPVIGPAIRKAISETLRQMLQSLNRTLEQSLSWRGIRWRVESIRTGIPFAQIALLHSLIYQVEQVFLIHRETGLLLCHLQHDGSSAQNPDLVSSMLAAINDFVTDSFAVEANKTLGSIEVGDLAIWIEAGPEAILATAIRGEAPNSLRTQMQQTLETVQVELGDSLSEFGGNTEVFEQRTDLLEDCLQSQFQSSDKAISKRTWVIAILILLLPAIWIGYLWLESHRLQDLVDRFNAEPGYLVTGTDKVSGVPVILGLKEPLSIDPEELRRQSKMRDRDVAYRFQPYQSLDPVFVLQRAQRILEPPGEVAIALEGKQLRVSGVAEAEWRDRMRLQVAMIAGIESVDDSALRLRFTPALLGPPPGVEMSLESGVLYLSGAAEQEWINTALAAADRYPEVDEVDIRGLVNQTEVSLIRDIDELERQAVFFDVSTSFDFDTIDAPKISGLVKSIIEKSRRLSRQAKIIVRGFSDSVGSFEDNQFLSIERADFVSQALFNTGISPRYIVIKGIEAPVEIENTEAERRYNRRVGFEVEIN